jgi:hypothetical protein
MDTSMSLPHRDRALEDSEKIIAERAGVRRSKSSYRSYFQDMWTAEDVTRYPSFLDFATSGDVLATVGHHLQSIPVLSTSGPPGIRFMESNAAFDDEPDQPHDSQLYHIDFYSMPNVYVIVLLRDTARENGPFTFLPRSVSQSAAAALNYWGRRCPYRIPDEKIYSVVDRKDVLNCVLRVGPSCLSSPRAVSTMAAATRLSHVSSLCSGTRARSGPTSMKSSRTRNGFRYAPPTRVCGS